MTIMKPTMTQLQVHKIESNVGFTIIQEGQLPIPTLYNYSLHVIDLTEIDRLITSLTTTISMFPDFMANELLYEISKLDDKLMTLQDGHHTIHKRGLFNFLGTIDKWVRGTMDDNDRQTINNHLTSIDTNNHNIITTINQQVQLNTNFSISIQKLAKTINSDREIIFEILTNQTEHRRELALLEIKFNIQAVDKILSDLQDNILLSNLNIIHPSILTHEEIKTYHITADKIKYLRIGFAKTTTGKLIFLVKIPFEMSFVNKKLIHPLRTVDNCQTINFPITHAIEHNNQYYEFDQNKALYQLNKLDHCIFKKNCEIIINCKPEIHILDDSSILIQLANNFLLTSTCDERILLLHGNYFIEFYNCTIILNNVTYFNQITEITHKYIIPTLRNTPGNDTLAHLTQIDLPEIHNIHPIIEVFSSEPFIYSSTIFAILFVLFILLIIFLYMKYISGSRETINSIQENLENSERGVMFLTPQPNKISQLDKSPICHPHTKILF